MINGAYLNRVISNYAVWFISAVYGFESGWSGPALKFLSSSNSIFLITPIDITWLSIVSTAGNIISIISCTIISSHCGRKPLLIACSVILTIGWALNCFADTFVLLLISKFLINFGLGIFDVLNCIYLSEISTTTSRGVVVSVSMVFFTVGNELEYVIGALQDYTLISAVPLLVSIISMFCSFFTVESPYFLIMNGKNEEAYKCLCVLEGTGDKEKVTRTYDELIQYVEEEKTSELSFFDYLSLPQNYRIFVCLLIVNSLVYFNGFGVYTGYEPIIMNPYDVNHDLILNILGISGMIAIFCSPFIIKVFGRKSLMWSGFLCIGVVQVFMTVCFYVESVGNNQVPYVPQILVFLATVGLMIYEFTLYPVTHVLRAEMLPHKLKEKGTSVIVIFKAIISGIISALFFPLALKFGYGINFVLYSIAAFVGFGYASIFLLETKDKSLVEIRKCYG